LYSYESGPKSAALASLKEYSKEDPDFIVSAINLKESGQYLSISSMCLL
jgi:hypothetical protein